MRLTMAAMIVAASTMVGVAGANEYALARARALYGQMQDNAQCEATLPAARAFWASSDFTTLTPQVRTAFLYEVMDCGWALQDSQAAIAASREARALGATWPDYALLQLGVRFDDHALAVSSFHALAGSDAATLAAMPWRFSWGAIAAANDIDPTGGEALRIHDVLEQKNYAPREGGNDDALRLDHARLLLGAGLTARARARLETVIDPRYVMMIRIERAFDPIRGDEAFERRLDVIAAAEADLARARAAAARTPRSMRQALDVAQALRVLGRKDEALAELDVHITRAQAAGGAAAYDDVEDQLNWLLNERAYVLYDMNRPEEARNVFGAAIAAGESGNWNVSQVINFASMLVSEGRAADALQVIRTVGEASPYGDMWAASVRACASAQLNDIAARDQALAFMREHTDDNPAAMTHAYLCVNDLDGAAQMYVRRLADQELRGAALIALQTYRRTPVESLPHENLLRERLDQVRAREDVRAAVDAVGRIEEVPLFSAYWGDV